MAKIWIGGNEEDVVYLHVDLGSLTKKIRDDSEATHKSRVPWAELSINAAADGSDEAMIKVVGWAKVDVPNHRAVIAVYDWTEIDTVRAIVRRPGWGAEESI